MSNCRNQSLIANFDRTVSDLRREKIFLEAKLKAGELKLLIMYQVEKTTLDHRFWASC